MTRQMFSFASAAIFALSVSSAAAQPTQDPGDVGPKGGPASSSGSPSPEAAPSSAPSEASVAVPVSSGGSAVSSGSTEPSSVSRGNSWGERREVGAGPRMDSPRRSGPAGYSADDGGQQRAVPRGGSSGSGASSPRGGDNGSGSGASSPRGGDNGSSGGRERAVPRGEGGGSAAGRTGTASRPSVDDESSGRQRAVPPYSRPREGRTAVGTPVERTEAVRAGRGGGGGLPWYYDPYFSGGYLGYYGYSPYRSYGYPGYGFGLGYMYDPFMFGSYWGADPYYGGGGAGYYGGGGSGYYQGRDYATGLLRLKIKPHDAKVYIDGYFVGVVDSFDGAFQKLAVEAGTHRVEIRADGFEPVQFEVMITPGETVTYKGDLKRIP